GVLDAKTTLRGRLILGPKILLLYVFTDFPSTRTKEPASKFSNSKSLTMNVRLANLCLITSLLATHWAQAQSLRITLPKHSEPSPVQKLNQDGVKALKQHRLEMAERLFYRAYLVDP